MAMLLMAEMRQKVEADEQVGPRPLGHVSEPF